MYSKRSMILAVTSALLLLTLATAVTVAAGRTHSLSGTIYGKFDYGKGAWVGNALLRFGDGAPQAATFIDENTGFAARTSGIIEGTETITFTFADGSTLKIDARFTGVPASTPNLYTLHEVGTISGGSGRYANSTGHVSVQGPFLLPNPVVTPGDAPWIAEIHGAASGID